MATGATKLKVQVIHGPKKYDISLALTEDQAGDVLCVKHLTQKVEELTQVPVDHQKLICKGKSLAGADVSLTEFGVANGSKIMLLGKKPSEKSPENKASMIKLQTLEQNLEKQNTKLSDIIHQADGMHRGFMEEVKESLLSNLKTQLAGTKENLMRMLETLDSLVFDADNTEGKKKRKYLADRINCKKLTTTEFLLRIFKQEQKQAVTEYACMVLNDVGGYLPLQAGFGPFDLKYKCRF